MFSRSAADAISHIRVSTPLCRLPYYYACPLLCSLVIALLHSHTLLFRHAADLALLFVHFPVLIFLHIPMLRAHALSRSPDSVLRCTAWESKRVEVQGCGRSLISCGYSVFSAGKVFSLWTESMFSVRNDPLSKIFCTARIPGFGMVFC